MTPTVQSSPQDISEEQGDNIRYSFSPEKGAGKGHRRIRYNHESALDLDETCAVRTIKAGTLKKLVEHLVPAFLRGDLSYIHTFLSNYRAFATTQQVLDLLFLRYGCVLPYSDGDGGPQDQLKDAISFILGTFLEEYSEDFDEPPDFLPLKMLKAYAQLNMPGSVIECQANLLLAQLEHPEPAETEQEAQVSPLELAQDPPRASPPEPAPDTSGALTLDEGPDPPPRALWDLLRVHLECHHRNPTQIRLKHHLRKQLLMHLKIPLRSPLHILLEQCLCHPLLGQSQPQHDLQHQVQS
nr:ral guanine nucleotide dissociation stimulator-like [Loxodonta africana]